MLITFEGLDGVGKTTNSKKLFKQIGQEFGVDKVILTHEPSGFIEIKNILLNETLDDYSELLLFLALRREHFLKTISPALEEKKIVICDRYIDSTIAYQGYGNSIPINIIHQWNRIVTEDQIPNLTFILDAEISYVKLQMNKNKFENKSNDFFYRVRYGFQTIAIENPNRCCLINIHDIEDRTLYNIFEQKYLDKNYVK